MPARNFAPADGSIRSNLTNFTSDSLPNSADIQADLHNHEVQGLPESLLASIRGDLEYPGFVSTPPLSSRAPSDKMGGDGVLINSLSEGSKSLFVCLQLYGMED